MARGILAKASLTASTASSRTTNLSAPASRRRAVTDPVRTLVDSVRIYSPSGGEAKVTAFFRTRMKAMGYSRVRADSAGNAVGEAGRGPLRVLLCGHIDTVPGELPVSLKGGILRGRGAVDAKAPMCAMLAAASRFVGDPVLRITLVAATDEEGSSRGIKQVLRTGGKYMYAVFGEPGGAGKVTVGYRGRFALNVSLSTAGGHAGSSWAHVSAYDQAAALVSDLRRLEQKTQARPDHFHSVSVTPTLFRAGRYQNVVPDHAEFTCDVRVPPGWTCADAQRELTGLIQAFSRRPGISVDYEFEEAIEPYEASPSSMLARAFQRAIILKAESRPALLKKTGTGDMNTFASRFDAECVTYGPGDSGLSHSANEAVGVADYLLSIEVLSEALSQLKILARRPNA